MIETTEPQASSDKGKLPSYVKLVVTHDKNCPLIPLKTVLGNLLIKGMHVKSLQIPGSKLDYVVLDLSTNFPSHAKVLEDYMKGQNQIQQSQIYTFVSRNDEHGLVTCLVQDEIVSAVLKPGLHSRLVEYDVYDGKTEYRWFNGRPSEHFVLEFDDPANVKRFKKEVLPEVNCISPD